jgi:hypothetical protein
MSIKYIILFQNNMNKKNNIAGNFKKGILTLIITNSVAGVLFIISYILTLNLLFILLTIILFIANLLLFIYSNKIKKKYDWLK